MVFSGRPEASDTDSSKIRFNGTTNVAKFFFVYEQAVMRTATPKERAAELLSYLDGAAFDFYYDVFAKDGDLTEGAKDFNAVKKPFFEHFKMERKPMMSSVVR